MHSFRYRKAEWARRSSFLIAITMAVSCAPHVATSRPVAVGPEPGPYDVVITGGKLVDGSGNAWFYGDVAIKGDRIARIAPRGALDVRGARSHIDATGLVVAPGFIDIQGQSGGSLLLGDGRDVSKLTQGVTTEILGEGETPAPENDLTLAGADLSDRKVAAVVAQMRGPHGFDAWLRAMQAHGISPNVGSFVGAGTIRQYGMGMREGVPSSATLDSMRAAVRRSMEDGAFGMASALIYPPNSYASTDELIEEAKAMAPYGGLYITHMRSEADKYLEAIDEAMRIGREGGVPVEIYHLKAAGKRNWYKGPLAIAKIDSARAAGLDIQADMYPYTAGETGLTACLPPWSEANGKLFENLKDPAMRAKIKAEVEHPTSAWENLCEQATPQGVLITELRAPEYKQFAGKRLSEIAAALGKDWIDTAMDLILADRRRVETIYFIIDEDNLKLQLRQPWMKIGTDAGGYDPDSTTSLVHPRSYGTYPRILGKYVRDEHVLSIEDAVRKMSAAVAERLSIRDRGLLREGMFADVVTFDPHTIIDHATYDRPHQISTGVRDVFVNGVLVVHDGKHTGAKPGRIVRGPGWVNAAR
jgi:N-acyl-D-aspartate/D-glutamate deacylase